MLLLVVVACMGVSQTGPSGMVGHVLAVDGQPISGLTIESVEAQAQTDETGAFSVPYKADNAFVHFQRGSLWYRRRLLEEDIGTLVEVRLPELRDSTLRCADLACAAELRWDLGQGLEARVTVACDPGAEQVLGGVPWMVPTVSCRRSPTADPARLTIKRERDALVLMAPAKSVRVELVTDGAVPDACVVRAGDRIASAVGPLEWSVGVQEPEWVALSCEGRFATPVRIERSDEAVRLSWRRVVPVLDLSRRAPWATQVVLLHEEEGWRLELTPREDHRVLLPPLITGSYRLLVSGGEDSGLELALAPPVPSRAGVVALAGEEGALVGRLRMVQEQLDGPVPIE